MKRKEAIALLTELGSKQLVNPNLILVKKGEPDSYYLKIKGDYDPAQLDVFLKKKKLLSQQSDDYIIISKA